MLARKGELLMPIKLTDFQQKTYSPKQYIWSEGETFLGFYVIEKGTVIYKYQNLELVSLSSGHIVGVPELLSKIGITLTDVIAAESVSVRFIPKKEIIKNINDPDFCNLMFDTMIKFWVDFSSKIRSFKIKDDDIEKNFLNVFEYYSYAVKDRKKLKTILDKYKYYFPEGKFLDQMSKKYEDFDTIVKFNEISNDEKDIYMSALQAVQVDNDLKLALALFDKFIVDFPDSPIIPEAYLWKAKLLERLENTGPEYVKILKKVIFDYPSSESSEEALYHLAKYYINSKKNKDAIFYLKLLIYTFPFSDLINEMKVYIEPEMGEL
jgi:tetratricopeptide (TPR) repeat protein